MYFLYSFSPVTSLHPNLTQLLSYTFARNGECILGVLLWLEITLMIYSAAKMQDQVSTVVVPYFCTCTVMISLCDPILGRSLGTSSILDTSFIS